MTESPFYGEQYDELNFFEYTSNYIKYSAKCILNTQNTIYPINPAEDLEKF